MDPILGSFQRVAAEIRYSEPLVAIVSNVTGKMATPDLMTSPDYWRQQIRNPVRFAEGIRSLRQTAYSVFLEIGAHPALTNMARLTAPEAEIAWAASLDRESGNWDSLLNGAATLYLHGVNLEWGGFYPAGRRIALPTYPFQRSRHWLPQKQLPWPPKTTVPAEKRLHPLLGKRLDSPALLGTVFELDMGAERPAFLNDHRISGRLIMPSPAYIEMGSIDRIPRPARSGTWKFANPFFWAKETPL
jgi:acyl transferase domain-containing protein